jgi:hypothetical protein
MRDKKQVLKTFPLDEEAQQASNWLFENGYNVSYLLREFLKREAKERQEFEKKIKEGKV